MDQEEVIMCGLVGVASKKGVNDRKWLISACKTLSHRGPDDYGEWWSKNNQIGMAHRRLSIIDLSSSAHQPMHLVDRGLSIIFNGEIYNHHELRQQLKSLGHSFHSQSDTEVLLVAYAEWGTNCLKYLNGMFASSSLLSPTLSIIPTSSCIKSLKYQFYELGFHFSISFQITGTANNAFCDASAVRKSSYRKQRPWHSRSAQETWHQFVQGRWYST